jgi:hypothetical protein
MEINHVETLCAASKNMSSADSSCNVFPAIVELNVGGVFYSTSLATLTSEPNSRLGKIFDGQTASEDSVLKDSKEIYQLPASQSLSFPFH